MANIPERLPFEYENAFVSGTPGVTLADVAHVIVPGYGRDETGMGLSEGSFRRALFAGQFFRDMELMGQAGVIVTCGYKTSSDSNGMRWSSRSEPTYSQVGDDQTSLRLPYIGIPEAFLMARVLCGLDIRAQHIGVEPRSIDSVTNLAYVEKDGYFGQDKRPVVIVAQEAHLERFMYTIAPRILHRSYVGLAVPEREEEVEGDSMAARVASRIILRGLTRDMAPAKVAEIAGRRARYLGRISARIVPMLNRGLPYNTDSVPGLPRIEKP